MAIEIVDLWWFSIAMLVYQRVCFFSQPLTLTNSLIPWPISLGELALDARRTEKVWKYWDVAINLYILLCYYNSSHIFVCVISVTVKIFVYTNDCYCILLLLLLYILYICSIYIWIGISIFVLTIIILHTNKMIIGQEFAWESWRTWPSQVLNLPYLIIATMWGPQDS